MPMWFRDRDVSFTPPPLPAPTCPNGTQMVDCVADPCNVTECPLHPDALCYSDFCGDCNARFFLYPSGEEVTETCGGHSQSQNCHLRAYSYLCLSPQNHTHYTVIEDNATLSFLPHYSCVLWVWRTEVWTWRIPCWRWLQHMVGLLSGIRVLHVD